MTRRPSIARALGTQLRQSPPAGGLEGVTALTRQLAVRLDSLPAEASPTGAASLARVLLEGLDRLRAPGDAAPSELERVLARLSAPLVDGADPGEG